MSDRAYILTEWSDSWSSWIYTAGSYDRREVVALAGRLALGGHQFYIVPCKSCEDDDVEAMLKKLKPPKGAFLAHDPDDTNA